MRSKHFGAIFMFAIGTIAIGFVLIALGFYDTAMKVMAIGIAVTAIMALILIGHDMMKSD